MTQLNVKEGYPDKLSNEEIREEMNNLKKYANGGGWKYEIIIAANTMIQTGLSTINDRLSKKYSKRLYALTAISLFLAIISVYFAFVDKRADEDWQQDQVRELRNIKNEIKNQHQ